MKTVTLTDSAVVDRLARVRSDNSYNGHPHAHPKQQTGFGVASDLYGGDIASQRRRAYLHIVSEFL